VCPQRYATDRETLESLCEVTFFKATGPGGQHRNKRETGVRLHHPPSGLTVTAVERRSQTRNLDAAFERMAEKLKQLNYVPKKRTPTKPSRAAKERRLDSKRSVAQKKVARRKPRMEEG
jgi:ribosome-associated protein